MVGPLVLAISIEANIVVHAFHTDANSMISGLVSAFLPVNGYPVPG
jgi:hypothetical protein